MKSHSRTRLGRTGIESGGCHARERSRADFPCPLDTKCTVAMFVVVVATISHVARMESSKVFGRFRSMVTWSNKRSKGCTQDAGADICRTCREIFRDHESRRLRVRPDVCITPV